MKNIQIISSIAQKISQKLTLTILGALLSSATIFSVSLNANAIDESDSINEDSECVTVMPQDEEFTPEVSNKNPVKNSAKAKSE